MSPFGIFTIVLISLYAVYYAVLITRDIYGKKNVAMNEEEEFDVSSLQEEEAAIGVEESENGFSLNPSRTKNDVVRTVSRITPEADAPTVEKGDGAGVVSGTGSGSITPFIPSIPSGIPVAIAPDEPASPSGGGVSAIQKKIDKVQDEMEEIEPMGNLTMRKEFFRDLLLRANKEGSLFVQKKHVPAV